MSQIFAFFLGLFIGVAVVAMLCAARCNWEEDE
jgi:hypothetical protein